MFRKIFW